MVGLMCIIYIKPIEMSKKILSIVLFPLLMLSMQHCKEDEPLTELEKLPPPTQSGKRTFGCLVDGKAWVIEQITHVQAFYQTGTLGISAGVLDNSFNSNFVLAVVDNNLSEKSYQFGEKISGTYTSYFDHRSSCEFLTSIAHNGTITITHFDNTNYIISGLFEFDVYSDDCTKVIKVTDGRFDIHYAAA
jgi:hypothetical protein